jgi:signal peptidase
MESMNRNACIILALFLTINIFLTLYIPGGLLAYVIPSICWATLALTTLILAGTEKILSWTNKRIIQMAILVAIFQIFLLIDAGLLNKFGKSPLLFTPIGIATNLMLVSSTLLGMELSRGYLTKNLSKKRPTLTTASITLLYTFANTSILALINFQNPYLYSKFMGETFLPILTENLLATYLALISGPLASLAYRAPMQAFWWFSPILPDIPWGYKSLIGVMAPTIGFIAINMATTQKDLTKAGIPTKKETTIKTRKSQKSIKGWLAISVFLVLAVWTSTGLFGFYPTIVGSGSMQPSLDVGDIAIVISTDPNQIEVGDIIQYWKQDEMILHRVIETRKTETGKTFITKGDANTEPDLDPVTPTQIRGKLIFIIPKLGWISIYLKEAATQTYNFFTTTLPNTIVEGGKLAITNGIYITTALALTAYSYLLLTYKNQKGGGKNE